MEKRHRNRAMHNLMSAGKATAKITGEAVNGLFRWLTTDHSGMGKALGEMPKMGFIASIKYALVYFLIGLMNQGVCGRARSTIPASESLVPAR